MRSDGANRAPDPRGRRMSTNRGRVVLIVSAAFLGLFLVLAPFEVVLPPAYAVLPARGSVPVGSASYPIPSAAIFVSPVGNDANAGTLAAPLRTIAMALSKVPTGGTVVIRGGVYHESAATSRTMSPTLAPSARRIANSLVRCATARAMTP